MAHFKDITSFGELKKQYRILAVANHPDKGGDTKIMQEINAEFEKLFKIWEHKKPAGNSPSGYEEDYAGATAKQYSESVYNEYRYWGHRYKGQSNAEILDKVREWLKETYPRYKFSVSKRHYSSLVISLIKADFEVFIEGERHRAHHDINHYWLDNDKVLTERAKEVMKNVLDYVMSYNYDDSDVMTDYFNTNFYLYLNIGTSKSPYKVETPKLQCAKSKLPPQFKHPEGKAHKAIRQALGGSVFQAYQHYREGQTIILGNIHFSDEGKQHFYPLSYSSAKTAQKRIDKLAAAGIRCKLTGRNGGYIRFEGYTEETERDMERERQEYIAAKKAWDEKQSNPQPPKAERTEPAGTYAIQLIDYSEKSFAVIGDTKPIKDLLHDLGGSINYRLKCGTGWIFSKKKLEEVKGRLHIEMSPSPTNLTEE